MSVSSSKKQQAQQTGLWLEQARAAHQQRSMQQAANLFQAVLNADPRNIEALNTLGMILAEHGQLEEGLKLVDKAIAAQASVGRSHFNRGIVLEHLRRYPESVASYNKCIAREPDFALAYHNRGLALAAQGKYDEALASYGTAISLNPSHAEAYSARGNALHHQGRYEEAVLQYDIAIQNSPSNAVYHNNKGVALKSLGRIEEAEKCHEQAIILQPGYVHAHNNLGVILNELGEYERALNHYDTAIALSPDYNEPYNNKGITLGVLRRYEESLTCFDRAIALNPAYTDAYNNKGFVLQEMKHYEASLACYNQAIALAPHHAAAYYNKSALLLVQGNFSEGWALYEWRWKRADVRPPRFTSPPWQGTEPVAGKTLLLYAEQGMGDGIQFYRYVAHMLALGAKVVLQVHAPLVPLLASMKVHVPVIAHEDTPPPHDYHVLLMSMPFLLHTELTTVPADVPYLFADAEKCNAWQQKPGASSKKRVGLIWSGNPKHKNNHNRSIPLALYAPLFALREHIDFCAVQKEIAEADAALLFANNIPSYCDALSDFTDTAALITALDIVVTVDTAVAHLAGALGKEVWILIPFAPDFRWLAEGETSPWYPTARLFRQHTSGEWQPVLEAVAAELAKHTGQQ